MTDRPIGSFEALEARLAVGVRAYTNQAIVPIDPTAIARTVVTPGVRPTIRPIRLTIARPVIRVAIVVGLTITILVAGIFVSGGTRAPSSGILLSDHAGIAVLDPGAGTTYRVALDTGPSPAQVSWSPDRSRIGYVVGSGDAATLWVADRNGESQHAVAAIVDGRDPYEYSWSPDGKLLALVGRSGGLAVADANQGIERWVGVPMQKDSGGPVWSPVGAFVAMTTGDGEHHIVVVDYDAYLGGPNGGGPFGAERELTGTEGGAYGPAWSPDGATIAYTSDAQELHLVGVDGSGDRVVGARLGYSRIDWAPSGRTIAVAALDSVSAVSFVDIATGSRHVVDLPGSPSIRCIRWAPDGGSIAVLDSTGNLWIMRPDGAAFRRAAVGVWAFDW